MAETLDNKKTTQMKTRLLMGGNGGESFFRINCVALQGLVTFDGGVACACPKPHAWWCCGGAATPEVPTLSAPQTIVNFGVFLSIHTEHRYYPNQSSSSHDIQSIIF